MSSPEAEMDRFLPRREAELVLNGAKDVQAAHAEAHDKAHIAHADLHGRQEEAIRTALAAVARERQIHADAHEREHSAHQREHTLSADAANKNEEHFQDQLNRRITQQKEWADSEHRAIERMVQMQISAHHEQHLAHDREHVSDLRAEEKAEHGLEKRLESMNEFRDQLREQAARFITRDVIEAVTKEQDRRGDALNQRIQLVEGDVKSARGYVLGVGAAVAILVIVVNFGLQLVGQ
ncbi:MAG: hypothetical protein LC798_11255 [Chloroflexi bacterium]|nr:hypothetical protein [Chloroflexota bacterium]